MRRRRSSALVRSLAAACWVLLLATSAFAADKVVLETGLHEGFGRIVFAWPGAVKFTAHVDEEKGVVVEFERPFVADLAGIAKQLPLYVESAAMDGDKTVILTLKRPLSLHTFAKGDRVAIDLLDKPGWPVAPTTAPAVAAAPPAPAPAAAKPAVAAAPPAPPPVAAKPAGEAAVPAASAAPPAVPVKLVERPGVRQLVFEWPKRVEVTTTVAKGEARIQFWRDAAIDAAQLTAAAADLSPRITNSKDEVTVTLTMPAGSKLKVYHRDNDVVLDLPPAKQSTIAAAPPVVDKTPVVKAVPENAAAEKPVAAKPADKAPVPKPVAETAPPGKTPEKTPPEKTTAEKAPAEKTPTEKPTADKTPANKIAAEKPPAETAIADKPLADKPTVMAAKEQPEPAAKPAAAPVRGPGPLSLRYASGDEGATLRFEWSKPVGAAVFRRGAYLWIVFGAAMPVDLADLRAKGQAAVTAVQQIPHATATILRLTTLKGFNPSLRRADNAWVVELMPQLLQPGAPAGVSLQPGAQPPRAFFAVREPGEPIVFRDPEIGDNLIVVPVGQVGQGIAREERLVDFTALLTAQGIALRPANDGVIARSVANGVEVTSRLGLILSDENDRALRRSETQPKLFDLADWFGARDGDVLTRRRALQQDIVAAAPVSRSGARLDLARFYFAHGYGPEALGVIEAIQRDDPGFAADPKVRALVGAAMLLAGDEDGAAHELGLHALDDEQDIALWRGSLAFGKRDWPRAAAEFARGEALLPSYPKALRNRLALQAAEAMLTTGQQEDAGRYLDLVLKDSPTTSDRASAQLLSARKLELAGDAEQSRALLDKLAAGDDRPSRARAQLARTLADLDSGALTRGQAIETLDGLRYAWRGDDFELTLLRRLGELKLKDGEYRGGLEALNQAMTNFPDHPEHRAVAQQLTAAFSDLFVGPEAENVPPLKALALYDEYRELTPAGDKGDQIIARLVDRLVGVDLLDRAATLLEKQVQFRLTGKDKARVATRLALVQLLDRKPAAALATLDGTAAGAPGGNPAGTVISRDIDANLLRQRQQLRARALLELRRSDEALAILAADNSVEADQLRADIYWRDKNWSEAAKTFARLTGAARIREGQLDEDSARIILNWGTALTLADDQPGVAKLAATYGAAMEASPFKDAFRVIAGGSAASSGDIRQLAGKVAQVSDLQGFMASYRERLAKQKLSAIN